MIDASRGGLIAISIPWVASDDSREAGLQHFTGLTGPIWMAECWLTGLWTPTEKAAVFVWRIYAVLAIREDDLWATNFSICLRCILFTRFEEDLRSMMMKGKGKYERFAQMVWVLMRDDVYIFVRGSISKLLEVPSSYFYHPNPSLCHHTSLPLPIQTPTSRRNALPIPAGPHTRTASLVGGDVSGFAEKTSLMIAEKLGRP